MNNKLKIRLAKSLGLDHESKKYQWKLSSAIQKPNIYYYNKMVTEVLKILTKLKAEGAT